MVLAKETGSWFFTVDCDSPSDSGPCCETFGSDYRRRRQPAENPLPAALPAGPITGWWDLVKHTVGLKPGVGHRCPIMQHIGLAVDPTPCLTLRLMQLLHYPLLAYPYSHYRRRKQPPPRGSRRKESLPAPVKAVQPQLMLRLVGWLFPTQFGTVQLLP